tara:strand:+ start:394 stop:765 length:372 start_codon:yes stop_codon:yes gene_type:complete
MSKFLKILIIALFLSGNHVHALDQINEGQVFKNIRCLVCQGQSIAESNSEFAQTVKSVIRDQINSGKNEDEIYNFLISKYGEWIVYKPELNKKNLLLWIIPYFSLILGGVFIFRFIRKKNKLY